MRIGLLTYHHSANYGAVMQSYATCRALKELGHEVEFINFQHCFLLIKFFDNLLF